VGARRATNLKLRILGAAGEVTGSNHMLEVNGRKVLIDCGYYQGKDEERHDGELFPFYEASDIDAVLLTHAHIDHSGRVPLLVKEGFKGVIYCTEATGEFLDIMWRDSAKIMREEAEWRTRKNSRRGLPPVEPLYGENDVDNAIKQKAYVRFDEIDEILPGFKVRFRHAGHILGSAIIETWLKDEESGETVKVVFSGDLGPRDRAIEVPPSVVNDADYVLIESTYGDRQHKSLEATRAEFQSAMEDALEKASKVLIPTFVVDRAQRVLYEFLLLQEKMKDKKMPPIYLDSPMGVKTTEIYSKHGELLSDELKERLARGEDPFAPEGFKFVRTADESKKINARKDGIVLAGSGMVSGGRIMHHIKHSIYKPDTHLFFVGYQAHGTLGRRLVDGAKQIRVAGEDVAVRAQIHTINGFSSHADRDDLLWWASNFTKDARFIVIHGELKASEALALGLKDLGYQAHVPALGEEFDLIAVRDEKVKIPFISPDVRETEGATAQDIYQALDAIMSRAEHLQKTAIDRRDYETIIPLLLSAKTLLDTAESVKRK
jgi:metallo-beta-lactamase family protein